MRRRSFASEGSRTQCARRARMRPRENFLLKHFENATNGVHPLEGYYTIIHYCTLLQNTDISVYNFVEHFVKWVKD